MCGTIVKPRRTKCAGSCVNAHSVEKPARRRAARAARRPARADAAAARSRSSTTSERTSATCALSGASSAQPTTCVAADGDHEAGGVARQISRASAAAGAPPARLALISRAIAATSRGVPVRMGKSCIHALAHSVLRRHRTGPSSVERLVDLRRGDDVRRQQADDRVRRAIDQQSPLERGLDDRPGRPISSRPHIRPAPRRRARSGAAGERAQPAARDARRRSRRAPSARSIARPGTPGRRGRRAGCRRRCCRDRRMPIVAATRSLNIAAPIGTPAPSALPSEIRSGFRPSAGE